MWCYVVVRLLYYRLIPILTSLNSGGLGQLDGIKKNKKYYRQVGCGEENTKIDEPSGIILINLPAADRCVEKKFCFTLPNLVLFHFNLYYHYKLSQIISDNWKSCKLTIPLSCKERTFLMLFSLCKKTYIHKHRDAFRYINLKTTFRNYKYKDWKTNWR